MILLDTDVAVDVLRGYAPALEWIGEKPVEEVALPGFVVMELMQGCGNRGEMRALQEKLRPYAVLWPRQEAFENILTLFARIHLSHRTGLLDALIAAVALEQDVPLHSFNEKHYRPIPGLTLVQPYERGAA